MIEQYFRVYAKRPGQNRFMAMDMNEGVQVANLFYATFFDSEGIQGVEKDYEKLEDMNPGWKFETRKV